jgi:hypothetical protein
MTYRTKLSTGIATGALLLASFAPAAFADIDSSILSNGAGSDNSINITQNSNVTVNQTNAVVIGNNVNGTANTGGNKANKNNGGNVTVDTGNATVNVTISNTNGGNIASLPSVPESNVIANVNDNAANSNNTQNIKNNSKLNASQAGACVIGNTVTKKAKTGKNKAKKNNQGSVTVTTGNANSTANLTNDCGFNVLNPVVE